METPGADAADATAPSGGAGGGARAEIFNGQKHRTQIPPSPHIFFILVFFPRVHFATKAIIVGGFRVWVKHVSKMDPFRDFDVDMGVLGACVFLCEADLWP